MDYKAINSTLNKYFDGTSTLEEEKLLKKYFDSGNIKPEHNAYKPLFDSFAQQHRVTNPRSVRFDYKQPKKNYKLAIAATLVIGLGIAGMYYTETQKETIIASKNVTKERKKEAYKELKKFSSQLNKGIERAGALSIFGKTTKRIFNLTKDKK